VWEPRSVTPRPGAVAGAVLVLLFLVVAGLIFFGVYITVTGPVHFLALLTIGFIALVFALVAYFAQALSRQPTVQRGLAFGLGAFGFAVLFLSGAALPWLYPHDNLISLGLQVVLLIFLVILLMGPVAAAAMAGRHRESDARRAESRAEWASHPAPSALSYASGQPPAPTGSGGDDPVPPMRGT